MDLADVIIVEVVDLFINLIFQVRLDTAYLAEN